MNAATREFQIFVKPAGPACNLGCTYCYYLGKSEFFGGEKVYRMPDEVLDSYIRQHIEASTEPVITFSWHGGEPMLSGLDFYRKVVEIQNRYNRAGRKIINGMQTNGTLVNENWCRFMADEQFVVGFSIDGPEATHNLYRRTKDGKSTFSRVIRGFDQLVIHGIDPEILCVVNSANIRFPLEVYRFFKQLGVGYITFIPLVERMTDNSNVLSNRSVPSEAFGDFLCSVFDEWVEQDIGRVKVQIFEEALRTAFHQDHTLCIFKPTCGGVPVVEHNGDFFACDHFVDSGHRIGNICKKNLAEMLDSDMQHLFGRAKRDTLPSYCLQCEVLDMCNGECPKNRFILTPEGEPGLNYLCTGYRKFFNHCRPFAEAVAKAYRDR